MTSSSNQLQETFKLLDEGENKIELREDYKDVALVLGNSGSGKSTFLQWIAGDNSKLIAQEDSPGSGRYIIGDGNNKIGQSTTKSKTIFPELVIHDKTSSAYYDCPGFKDSRSTSHDIAATYFIKKVTDHAKSVKLIFVVSQHSVSKGVDRHDFMTLLKHSTNLIKDIDKFKDSVAMVVSKVENVTVKKGKVYELVSDDKIIEAVADFLRGIRLDLAEKLATVDVEPDKKQFFQRADKFVEVLLIKQGENYSRIGIFRRPDEPGPLSEITLLQEGKEHIENIIYKEIQFKEKNDADFGYTVSDKSKTEIFVLVSEIEKNIIEALRGINERIVEYFKGFYTKIEHLLASSDANFLTDDEQIAESFDSYQKMRTGSATLENLANFIRNLTSNDVGTLPTRLDQILNVELALPLRTDEMTSISKQVKYLEFLQAVSDVPLIMNPVTWGNTFSNAEGAAAYLLNTENLLKLKIDSKEKGVNGLLQSYIGSLAESFRQYFSTVLDSLSVRNAEAKLSNLEKEFPRMYSNSTLDELVKMTSDFYFRSDVKSYEIRLLTSQISDGTKLLKFVTALKDGNDTRQVTIPMNQLGGPFNELKSWITESRQWYTFLQALFEKFSEHEIQVNIRNYNIANVGNWGTANTPQGIFVNGDNFKQFLSKLQQYNLPEHVNVVKVGPNESRLRELNSLFRTTLRSDVSVICPESGKLVVLGNYVRFTDFLTNSGRIKDGFCASHSSLKTIEVFALHSVFIDQNFNGVGQQLQFTIIAPKWDIVRSVTIDLNGSPGEDYSYKAADGNTLGSSGNDGNPGYPGGSGGSFSGIGLTYVNPSRLTISTKGGDGGKGQDGGDGAKGRKGPSVKPPVNDSNCPASGARCRTVQDNLKMDYSATYILCKGTTDPGSAQKIDTWTPGFWSFGNDEKHGSATKAYLFNFQGNPGGRGGTGGNGGVGGMGGLGGPITLVDVGNNSALPNIHNPNGSRGNGGKGGGGGSGGWPGSILRVWLRRYSFSGTLCGLNYEAWGYGQEQEGYLGGPVGSRGSDGVNARGLSQPSSAASEPPVISLLNRYRKFVGENGSNRFLKTDMIKFLDIISTTESIRRRYDVAALLEEFSTIQEIAHNFSAQGKESGIESSKPLVYLYHSLLSRVIDYAKTPLRNERSQQYKKTLNYLYTTILSKLYDLKSGSESDLIINIDRFMDEALQQVQDLGTSQEKNSKAQIINKYKETYKDNLMERIKEANAFVENEIKPEIENLERGLEEKTRSLFDEILALEKEAVKKREDLIEKKKQAEYLARSRDVFSFVKVMGQVVGFLGPVGVTAGSVIGGVTSMSESLVLDNKAYSQGKPLTLPSGVTDGLKSLDQELRFFKDQKILQINRLTEFAQNMVDQAPEKLSTLSSKVKEIKVKLDQVRNEPVFDLQKVITVEDTLKASLVEAEKDLKSSKTVLDEKTANVARGLAAANRMAQFGSVGLDIYSKYQADQAKIDAISTAIDESEKKIKELDKYKEKFYETIAPMLKNIGDYARDITGSTKVLESKSLVGLDITKWRIQSFLKDMELQIRQLTQGFTVGSDLARFIGKLEEAMSTMIKIYDRVQVYQEQQLLANYIGDISSVAANSIAVTDPRLSSKVNEMEELLKSNLILKQYKVAVSSVKQWVFPFAHMFLQEFELPEELELEKNVRNLAIKAQGGIRKMKSQINRYKTSISTSDQYTHKGEFHSKYVSSRPFFVWRNADHGGLIGKLLSGQKVLLASDIFASPVNKDAIKFSRIDLNFRCQNSTLETEMQAKLRKFTAELTHMGTSYYRYDNKVYAIASSAQKISFSFEKNNETPIHKNIVYDKLLTGDIVLSPYTMWEMQLKQAAGNAAFQELNSYKNQVDLELVGHGSYVTAGSIPPTSLKVDDYYKPDDSVFKLSLPKASISTKSDTPKEKIAGNSVPMVMPIVSEQARVRRSLSEEGRTDKTGSGTKVTGVTEAVMKKIPSISFPWWGNEAPEPTGRDVVKGGRIEDLGESSFQDGPTTLEMGDQWLKSTDMNGLLAWGVFLARKLTGSRPVEKGMAAKMHNAQIATEVEARRIVDAFIEAVLESALACGIRHTVAGIFNQDVKKFTQAVQMVQQKLRSGRLETAAGELYKLLVQPYINRIALKTTSLQAKRFDAKIKHEMSTLQEQWLLQWQDLALNGKGKVDFTKTVLPGEIEGVAIGKIPVVTHQRPSRGLIGQSAHPLVAGRFPL